MKLWIVALLPVALAAQTDLRVTAQTLSPNAARALFGTLPKAIAVAAVQVCSGRNEALTIPLARIVQQVKLTNGATLLPTNVALTVIASSQGSTAGAKWLRGSMAAVEIASGLVVGKVLPLNPALSLILSGVAFGGQIIIPAISGAIPTHALLALTTAALPDPLQLQPLGCATGLALVETNSQSRSIDFSMVLPRELSTGENKK